MLTNDMLETMDDYLTRFFLSEDEFSSLAGLSVAELRALVEQQRSPGPAYVVRPGLAWSFVFGERPSECSRTGAFYPRGFLSWATFAASNSPEVVRARFREEWREGLELSHRRVRALPDLDVSADDVEAALETRLDNAFLHFLKGTFGVCVVDPSSVESILEKELLQEWLTHSTGKGAFLPDSASARAEIARWVERYDQVAMPFAPHERPLASRRLLVDGLREKLKQRS